MKIPVNHTTCARQKQFMIKIHDVKEILTLMFELCNLLFEIHSTIIEYLGNFINIEFWFY